MHTYGGRRPSQATLTHPQRQAGFTRARRTDQKSNVGAQERARPLLLGSSADKTPACYTHHDIGIGGSAICGRGQSGRIPKLTSHGPPLDPPHISEPIRVLLASGTDLKPCESFLSMSCPLSRQAGYPICVMCVRLPEVKPKPLKPYPYHPVCVPGKVGLVLGAAV